MSTYEWAERECRIACKRENPNYDFDKEESFDYGCSCYKSALKAYKSLCEDGHSGTSWNITKNILMRLMDDMPLTPITEEDFADGISLVSEDILRKSFGLKSDVQCSRMPGLFRKETLDGKVKYIDIDRAYFINIDNPRLTYNSNTDFLDEMFPITLPYYPKKGKYKIYAQDFLVDEKEGDFDTVGIFYMITPEGERIDLNIYKKYVGNEVIFISKEEYDERYEKRIIK